MRKLRLCVGVLLVLSVDIEVYGAGRRGPGRQEGYSKNKWKVIYDGREVQGASASSFENLGRGYAEDDRHDHCCGARAKGSGRSRGRRPYGYTKDAWAVYFGKREVEGASVATFEELGGGYGKDAWKVYFRGAAIADASASTFEFLGKGYAKDAWKVYYNGSVVSDASVTTFEVLDEGYAKDAWKVYNRGKKIPDASPSTFALPDRRF